ncbi:HepT-like ribonuclease domain-containing protein [Sulfurospirillum cavolei]|uniref:HepT-like ribonuclease domain-containing protein n=1 Tax=Sulfurospirillum cavolei TaxID=366522 RepID=UPI000764BA9E|nr:HepT-like ribonuclease domain-containing protein [Sulfurospirillum cavolei]
MSEQELVKNILEQMILSCERVEKRFSTIHAINDFLDTEEGIEKLDGICMQIIALGESVKNLDKITHKKLLSHYPQIVWSEVAGMRDIISHHYFDLNAEIVFEVCQNHITELKETLEMIQKEL